MRLIDAAEFLINTLREHHKHFHKEAYISTINDVESIVKRGDQSGEVMHEWEIGKNYFWLQRVGVY